MKENALKIVNNLRLETPIGKGAMGEVWKARHIHTGATVAAKFLLKSTRQDDWALESFQSEIRAAAGLTHPNAVMVLDHGFIGPNNANNAARIQLQTGAPFLIMELVQGKPLKKFAGKLPWGRLKRLIQQLLSVLAHAHARGVIHRDIKPENVLVKLPDEDSSRPEAMLTDFGLAQALSEFQGDGDVVAGTPAYMAPEQLLGSWRDQGPWTDLYSLACTIWRIIAPEAPFGNGGNYADLAYAHVHQPPPPLLNTIEIPEGLDTWLLRMLAKRPQDRFYSAAEALFAINELGPADISPELNIDDSSTFWELSDTMEFTRERTRALLENKNEMPIPDDWRSEAVTRSKLHIMGVGLKMFDIRSLPFFGREKERDSMWQILKEVPSNGAQSITIRGPSGIGKSRLAQWFCERAQETGVAEVFHIDNVLNNNNGVVEMLASSLRCQNLDLEETKDRLGKILSDFPTLSKDTKKIAAILTNSEDDDLFKENWKRNDLIVETLLRNKNDPTALAKPRMAIIWNDNAHYGEAALKLCLAILQSENVSKLPILFVHTIQPESITHENPCRVGLAKIQNNTRNQTFSLDAFNAESQKSIINSMLDLSPKLVGELVSFSNGHCDLAKMVLSDLVQEEALILSDTGFRLKPGVKLSIPTALNTVWNERLSQATAPFREQEQRALEIAATMGMTVVSEEWKAALPHFKADQFRWIEGELVAAKLIKRWQNGGGWSFVHPTLPILLVKAAEANNQTVQVNLAAAKGVQTGKRSDKFERIGRHLIKGELIQQGINALLRGLMLQLGRANFKQTLRIAKELNDLFEIQQTPKTDSKWGQIWLCQLTIAETRHNVEEAEKLRKVLEDALINNNWPIITAKYSLQMGRKAENHGNLNLAVKQFESGLKNAAHSPTLRIQLMLAQVQSLIQYGQLNEARERLAQMVEHIRKENPFDVALYQYTKACLRIQAQDFTGLEKVLKQAGAGFSAVQQLVWKALSIKCFGDVCWFQNDLSTAKKYYQKSQSFLSQSQHPFNAILLQDLAIVALYESEFNEALTLAQEALQELSAMNWKRWIPRSQLIAMCVLAEYEDWGGFEFHYYSMISLVEQIDLASSELAQIVEIGAKIIHKHGDTERAIDLLNFGISQWQRLGLEKQAQRLRNQKQELG